MNLYDHRALVMAGGRSMSPAESRESALRHAVGSAAPSTSPLPALPAEAVVDPRLGHHGPALLALEDGRVFPGVAFGAPI